MANKANQLNDIGLGLGLEAAGDGGAGGARPLPSLDKKAFVFISLARKKNEHAPALHLLNMRHAATQTRPGVCRIHFHLRDLIVSRRSPCSVFPYRDKVRGSYVARECLRCLPLTD